MKIPKDAKILRIKRANAEWWISERSIVGCNGLTYIAYCTDMGEIHLKELDAKCALTPSRDVCLCRLNYTYADEHNSPSLCILENGNIIVAYTGHGASGVMHYRITQRPYDIFSFGPEQKLQFDGSVTYAQLFENTTRKELWLFTRVNGVTWQFRYSRDAGVTFSEPRTVFASDQGGLYYAQFRRQLVAHWDDSQYGAKERFVFAIYGHPILSKDHVIHSGLVMADGTLCDMEENSLDINLFADSKLFPIEELPVVYRSPKGETARLLAVASTEPLRIGLAAFTYQKDKEAVYHVAAYRDGAWQLSAPIVSSGEFMSDASMIDGSQTYVSGCDFYYGVGAAGFYPRDPAYCDTDLIFISRKRPDGTHAIESYVTHDRGATYTLHQTIRVTDAETKIWRPTVPVCAQDNLPVYWHEGTYTAHTGGWHCDAVLPVEYDQP